MEIECQGCKKALDTATDKESGYCWYCRYCQSLGSEEEPVKKKEKKPKSAMDRVMNKRMKRAIEGRLISKDNPWKTITVTPTYYGCGSECLQFVSQLCAGYLWSIKNDVNFIARHDEKNEIQNLLGDIESYTAMRRREEKGSKGGAADLYGENFEGWILVRLGLLIGRMWD